MVGDSILTRHSKQSGERMLSIDDNHPLFHLFEKYLDDIHAPQTGVGDVVSIEEVAVQTALLTSALPPRSEQDRLELISSKVAN